MLDPSLVVFFSQFVIAYNSNTLTATHGHKVSELGANKLVDLRQVRKKKMG
jgi:hypothetical protein